MMLPISYVTIDCVLKHEALNHCKWSSICQKFFCQSPCIYSSYSPNLFTAKVLLCAVLRILFINTAIGQVTDVRLTCESLGLINWCTVMWNVSYLICAYVHMYLLTYTNLCYVRTAAGMCIATYPLLAYVHVYVCTCAITYIQYTHTCKQIPTHTHAYTIHDYMYTHNCAHIYMHIYIYTKYAHIYTH